MISEGNDKIRVYVFVQNTDKFGSGSEEVYMRGWQAMNQAQTQWDSLAASDKKRFTSDPAGKFCVYEIAITPEELAAYRRGELKKPLSEFWRRDVWSAF